MGENSDRADFEKWANTKWPNLDEFDLRKREDGSYKDSAINGAWQGWQARGQQEPLTAERIAEIASSLEASDPTDSFWRSFARAIEREVKNG